MRFAACTTVALVLVACSSFGTVDDGSSAGTSDGGSDGSTPTSAEGGTSGCAGHLFCEDFESMSFTMWPRHDVSTGGEAITVAIDPAAWHTGSGGLYVAVPGNNTSAIWNRYGATVPSVPGAEITLTFWIRFAQVNTSSSADTEIAAVSWGEGTSTNPSEVILEHGDGAVRLMLEEGAGSLGETTTLPAPTDWTKVEIKIQGLTSSAPSMQLTMGSTPTAAVTIHPTRPFTGTLGLELGAGYVDPNIAATGWDIDDLTLDAH